MTTKFEIGKEFKIFDITTKAVISGIIDSQISEDTFRVDCKDGLIRYFKHKGNYCFCKPTTLMFLDDIPECFLPKKKEHKPPVNYNFIKGKEYKFKSDSFSYSMGTFF